MKIILEDNNKLLFTILDDMVNNWWIIDSDKKELINIVRVEDKLILKSNEDIKILKDISKNKTKHLLI